MTSTVRTPPLGAACAALFTVLAAETAAAAADQDDVDRVIAAAEASDLAYDLVERLTTEVGPRLAGTEAEARARDWAVDMFHDLGFANVRVEPFAMDVWERGDLDVAITAPYAMPLYATALGGSGATPPGGVEGEIAYFASLSDLKAAPQGDEGDGLAGKIVFVDDAMTRTQTGEGYGPAVQKRGHAWREAQARGAAAVMIRSVGTDTHRQPHTGGMSYEDDEPKPAIAAVAVSAPDADQIQRLVAGGETVRVRLVATPTWRAGESGNVIAEIRGRGAADEVVVLGAHLDSWDLGTGAIDDASGVAVVTAAAKIVADLPGRTRRTVRVVLFGAEEPGLLGADAYVAAHADDMANHVMGAESDFGADRIWRFDTNVGEGALPAADAIAASLAPLGIIRGGNDSGGGSDVSRLKEAGVPVAELQQNGWDYFDLHHTPDDTLDKIDPGALAQNVAAYAAFLLQVADSDVDFRAPAEADATAAEGGEE